MGSARRIAVAAMIMGLLTPAIGSGAGGSAPAPGAAGATPKAAAVPPVRWMQAHRRLVAAHLRALATPAAQLRRKRSRTAYRRLSDARALAIARRAFPAIVSGTTYARPSLGAGSRIERYLDDHRAVIRSGAGAHALVVSTLPLRATSATGRTVALDLSLRRRGSFFVPETSPVPAELPVRLRDGARLTRSGVGITPVTRNAGVVGRAADGKVFYANADRDTDELIAPRPGGLESFSQLRSLLSPEQLTFELSLPRGAVARNRSDAQGIDIVRDGRRLASVGAPVASDADGQPVRTAYNLSGAKVVVAVRHRHGDFRYPILVDPSLTESFDFRSSNSTLNSPTGWTFFAYGHPNVFQFTGYGPEGAGLYSYVPQNVTFYGPGNGFTWGDQGDVFWVTPPGTNIFRVDSTASTLQFWDYLTIARGIWNPSNNTWAPGQPKLDTFVNYTNNSITQCADGSTPSGGCPNQSAGLEANEFWMQFFANKTGADNLHTPYAYLSAANIYIHDGHPPSITSVPQSETSGAWRLGNETSQFTVGANDSGLGLTDVKVVSDDSRVNQTSSAPCNGHRDSRCPTSAPSSSPNWTPSFSYNTTTLREGTTRMTATAGDAGGNRSSATTWDVRIDRTKPQATVSGSLSGNGAVVGPDDVSVRVAASDEPSGVRSVELKVDTVPQGQPRELPNCRQDCPPVDFSWDNSQAADGPHTLEVTVKDLAGNETTERWTIHLDTEAPEIDLSGGLIEYGGRALPEGSNELTIDATDEAEDGPRFGVDRISISIDGTPVSTTTQTCPGSQRSCPLTASYSTANLLPGPHRVAFTVSDRGGNEDSDDWLTLVEEPEIDTPSVQAQPSATAPVRIDGANTADRLGESLTGLGDINGDGFGDYAIGAPNADPAGRQDAGTVYVLYGRKTGVVDLRAFSSADGYRIDGANAGDHVGTSLSSASDVNGDEVRDLIIGAPRNGLPNPMRPARAAVYVVFGGATTDMDLQRLDDSAEAGDPGFRIDGPPPPLVPLPSTNRPFGTVIAPGTGSLYDAGIQPERSDDINDDGLSDIVLGASDQGNNGRFDSGSAYVIFGKASTATVSVDSLGTAGVRIDGAAPADHLGYSVASIGDWDGDGYGDIAVGAPNAIPDGRVAGGAAYVIFGGPQIHDVDAFNHGAAGSRISGKAGDHLGASVAALDDVSDDGLADLAAAGRQVFVAFGRDDGQSIDASASQTGSGYRVEGSGAEMLTVAEVGDAERDGVPDMLVATSAPTTQGTAWLVFGTRNASTQQLTALPGQRGETWLPDASDGGLGPAAAGGRATGRDASDQLIGAPGASRNARPQSGSVYVQPGVERPGCVEGYDFSPADDGALVTCMEGESTLAIDRNRDGTADSTPDNPQATAARRTRGNRRVDRGDTGIEGVVAKRGSHQRVEWFIQRTGITWEVSSNKAKEVGRVRISDRIRLRGNIAVHKDGRVRVINHVYKVRPRFYAICQERRARTGEYRDGCNRHEIYVFKQTINYYTCCGGIHFVNEERSMHGTGKFRWKLNISGNMMRIGIEGVSWSPYPQMRSKKYYCKKKNLACQFYAARK